MKSVFFATLAFVTLFSCSQEKLEYLLSQKINLFNIYGDSLFYGFAVSPLRENENSVYSVTRFDTLNEYAIIELYPHSKIHKNFSKDTIKVAFAHIFGQLHCTSLIYINNCAMINFRFYGDKYLLFRGYPQSDDYIPCFDTTDAIKIDARWYYLKLNNKQ